MPAGAVIERDVTLTMRLVGIDLAELIQER
jgi:hypothetical protein